MKERDRSERRGGSKGKEERGRSQHALRDEEGEKEGIGGGRTVLTEVTCTPSESMLGSFGESATGQTDTWPLRGSRTRPEIKEEAAEEGS